jgi:ribosomal protein S20
LLSDKTRNQNVRSTAETYVKDFCAAYGKVSAERIAETIENIVAQTTFRRDNDSPQKNLL